MDFANVLQDKIRNLEVKVQILTKIIQLTNQWAQNEFGVTIPDHILAYKLDEKTIDDGGDLLPQDDIKSEHSDELHFDLDLLEDTGGDQERSSSADLVQNEDNLVSSDSSSSRSQPQLSSSGDTVTKRPIVLLKRLPNDHPTFKKAKIPSEKPEANLHNTCASCGIVFEKIRDLKNHLLSTGHGRYRCPICSYDFLLHNRLKKHMDSHKKDKIIDCPNCDKKFTTILNRNIHLNRGICKTLDCPFEDCHLKFGTQKKLNTHLKLHNPTQEDQNQNNDDSNILQVNQIKKFECKFCTKSYNSSRVLRSHLELFHNVNYKGKEWSYVCTWPGCGKGFEMHFFFTRHLKLHQEPPTTDSVICEKCGVSVKQKDLKTHIEKVHFQKKRCKCTFPGCNKLFYTQSEMIKCLRKHQTTPEEKEANRLQNRLACDQCGTFFANQRTLDLHILAIHQKLKPHKCTVGECTWAFSSKTALMVHYSVHLNPSKPEFNEEFSRNCPESLTRFLQSRKVAMDKYNKKKLQKNKDNKCGKS